MQNIIQYLIVKDDRSTNELHKESAFAISLFGFGKLFFGITGCIFNNANSTFFYIGFLGKPAKRIGDNTTKKMLGLQIIGKGNSTRIGFIKRTQMLKKIG